eukprot:CAMPEP_0179857964 /NCGR_PEP_ID=MMETSP0982-20121206/12065_1 /TAXON_ID=483367 /ORGANISM="non described non described, Strain CCMP 2436" /LENGTH=316 /DNA_ID=CAMNT_0021744587 /DNA_START=398 /DNA_END=1349 /DNA_ORIENTATION=-
MKNPADVNSTEHPIPTGIKIGCANCMLSKRAQRDAAADSPNMIPACSPVANSCNARDPDPISQIGAFSRTATARTRTSRLTRAIKSPNRRRSVVGVSSSFVNSGESELSAAIYIKKIRYGRGGEGGAVRFKKHSPGIFPTARPAVKLGLDSRGRHIGNVPALPTSRACRARPTPFHAARPPLFGRSPVSDLAGLSSSRAVRAPPSDPPGRARLTLRPAARADDLKRSRFGCAPPLLAHTCPPRREQTTPQGAVMVLPASECYQARALAAWQSASGVHAHGRSERRIAALHRLHGPPAPIACQASYGRTVTIPNPVT